MAKCKLLMQTAQTQKLIDFFDGYEDEVEMIVQVNGKVRAKIKMAKDTDRDEAQQLALANEHVKKFTDGKDIKKVIVVPNKIVNIVAK